MRLPTYLLVAIAVASVSAGAAGAQAIHGTVRDAMGGDAIPGVVVLALDSTAAVRSRVVTDSRGDYRIVFGTPVRLLRFVRIGFAPEERRVSAADTGFVRLDVSMRALSHLLAAVQVRANPNCPRRPDGELAFSLWEQSQAALLAAVVARETNPPRVVRLAYKRVLSLQDRIVQQLVHVDSTAVTARPFVAVLSSEDFVRGGFSRDTAGMRKYLVPYADVLLEDAFASGHCFRVREGGATRPNQVGLGFETARRQRGRVDVDGTIWVDTAARTLVGLEFRYVGLAEAAAPARPGGEIWFRPMTNGLLVIDRWHIRGTGGTERPPRDALGELPRIASPISATQYGGEIVEAIWPDGLSWHARLGRFALRAVDSSGRPVGGYDVRLRGTNYAARANDQGRAEITELLPGPYRAVVVDSLLGSIGLVAATSLDFTAQRDVVVERRLTIRSAMDAFRDFCSASSARAPDDALLVVRVTSDGRSATDASWEVRRERTVGSRQPRAIGPESPVFARGQHPSPDGTLDKCLRLKKGDSVRVAVWRDGQPAVIEERVLENDATVIGLELPARR